MRTLMTSRQWLDHFATNAKNQLPIPWEAGVKLTASETRAIIKSLQAWQLGETGEGKHLLAAARRSAFSGQHDINALQCFIIEEQRHGELLGRFLDLHGAGRIKQNWTDHVFRRLRAVLTNLEVWTTVVIIVETLALIYYRAVKDASQSPVLKAICQQIIRDEVFHLRFQYERLTQIYSGRPACLRSLTRCLQYILFLGTMLVVWKEHRQALRAGGYTWRRYWNEIWKRMRFHWMRMELTSSRQAHRQRDAAPIRLLHVAPVLNDKHDRGQSFNAVERPALCDTRLLKR